MHCAVRLVGNNGGINGFLVQARLPGNAPGIGVNPMLLGSFQAGSGQQTLDCDLMAGAANEVSGCNFICSRRLPVNDVAPTAGYHCSLPTSR